MLPINSNNIMTSTNNITQNNNQSTSKLNILQYNNVKQIIVWKQYNNKNAMENIKMFPKSLLFDNNGSTIMNIDLSSSDISNEIISNLTTIDDNVLINGYNALKLLQLFGATYIDSTNTQLKYINLSNQANNNPAANLNANILDQLANYRTVEIFLNSLINKLNNSGISPLTLENMSSDKSTKQMRGGSNTLYGLKNSLLAYNDSVRSYLFGGVSANFPVQDNLLGGAITHQGDYLEKTSTNKSFKVFEELWNNLKKILNQNGKTIDPTTSQAIDTNLTQLKNAEDQLIKSLDELMASAILGKNASATVPNPSDITEFTKLFKTVERRQLRIVGALGNLWSYVPQFDLPVVNSVIPLSII
jgi:hypothetical protein